VYSHDVVSRLSLDHVRDIRNTVLWLCNANEPEKGNRGEGYSSVIKRARNWKAGAGSPEDPDWVCSNKKVFAITYSVPVAVYCDEKDFRGQHANGKYIPTRPSLVGNERQRLTSLSPTFGANIERQIETFRSLKCRESFLASNICSRYVEVCILSISQLG
jgi:hypothetical protein